MNWQIKGLAQNVLSVVPGGNRLNDFFQRTVGGLRDLSREIGIKVSDWSIFVSNLNELGFPVRGVRCFEIGTGWFPTLPVCFSLAGAARCSTFDLVAHLSPNLTFKMLAALEPHLHSFAGLTSRPAAEIDAAYRRLRSAGSVPELLSAAGVDYHAPADATATDLLPGTVDLVFSNSVLEHVSRGTISAMMRESYRVLRPGGLAVHSVNCGDHYAYFDRRITAINYLTYTDREWRFWNNRILFQNRLRPRDLLGLAKEAGFEIVLHKQKPRKELLAALPGLRIAPEFQGYPPEELCCTSVDFVARKA
jgi:SAM-dependent methyltransferase